MRSARCKPRAPLNVREVGENRPAHRDRTALHWVDREARWTADAAPASAEVAPPMLLLRTSNRHVVWRYVYWAVSGGHWPDTGFNCGRPSDSQKAGDRCVDQKRDEESHLLFRGARDSRRIGPSDAPRAAGAARATSVTAHTSRAHRRSTRCRWMTRGTALTCLVLRDNAAPGKRPAPCIAPFGGGISRAVRTSRRSPSADR